MVPSKNEDCFEVSAYKDPLTPTGLAKASKKLVTAFPTTTIDFIDILSNRIKELNIGDKQLMDMVNHTIDTCVYPTPTIATLISYDKKVKIYDYRQLMALNDREYQGKAFHYFKQVKISDEIPHPMYAHIRDIEQYNLEQVLPDKESPTAPSNRTDEKRNNRNESNQDKVQK